MKSALVHDRALVLRRTRYGESSLVVQVLAREHGRVHLLAKGAYRATSAYCGVLDVFDELELGWPARPAQAGGLALLRTGAIRRRRTLALSADLARYRRALEHLELAELAAREAHEERELYDLVDAGLERLCAARVDPLAERIAFDLRFLHSLGLRPALVACASCGASDARTRATASVAFSAAAGGRLCERCAELRAAAGERSERVAESDLRVAHSLIELADAGRAGVRLEPALARRVQALAEAFLVHHLEHAPRSRRARSLERAGSARSAS